jgi:glycosyltransferase involved in cell wall biosynthesis
MNTKLPISAIPVIPNEQAMKKICFLCSSTSFGGLEMNIVRCARWMAQRGWHSVVYSVSGSPLTTMAVKDGLATRHIRRNRKYGDVPAAFALKKLLKQDDIRIVLFRDNRDLNLAVMTKLLLRGKLVLLYFQAMQIGVDKKDLYHSLHYRALDAWLASLHWLAEQAKERTRIDPRKVHVIHLGIETKPFATRQYPKDEARQTLGIPPEPLLLGMLGRIGPGKRQDFVIDALHKLQQRGNNVQLLIMGEPTRNESMRYADSLRTNVSSYGLGERVHFRPFSSNVHLFYCAIDIFIMASRSETFGLVTIEAMASGIPIVATNAGGPREILKHGQLGMLFDQNSVEQLSENIETLMANPQKADALGKAAREEAIAAYSHTRQCEQIEAVISAVRKNEELEEA